MRPRTSWASSPPWATCTRTTSSAPTWPCCAPPTRCRRCWWKRASSPIRRKRRNCATRRSSASWPLRSWTAWIAISRASRRRERCMPCAPKPRAAHARAAVRSWPPWSRAGPVPYHRGVAIRQLPDVLINQIAAGEVVERPASVVKELVENALDAGARRVDIDLEEGGVRLIRIRDDGSGIAAADLPLAVARHATSKIASLDDLESVATLGFRGEALPSIASVSRFLLASRLDGAEHGAALQVDGGRIGEVAPRAHPRGTTAEVRDLFYNVPARRRFLRAERTELSHIEEWLRSLALARPDVELRVSHNGKASRRYRALDLLDADATPESSPERLLETLGDGFAANALRIDHAGAGLRLHGWIARPVYNRASTDQQYLYVNGRSVRDRNVAHAVRQAYSDVLF